MADLLDLVVVGGGPGGTAAAITAAGCGARVLLLERGRFPRHKVCGEFISAEGVALLEQLGLMSVVRAAPKISAARLFAGTAVAEAPVSPPAASISRYELDDALWRLAIESGADCRQSIEVRAVHGTGPFTLETAAGTMTTRAVVNASGRWSNLRRRHSRPPQRASWVGWKAHFCEADHPAPSVDLYFFAGGYCGVQPLGNGGVNVCAMARATVARSLAEVLSLHPTLSHRSRNWEPVFDPITTAPLLFGHPQPVENGVLLVGDAAGFIDPFLGDGITLALRGGIIAALALKEFWPGRTSLTDAVNRYSQEYDRELRPLFRNASWLRRLTSIPQALHTPVMAIVGSPRLTRFFIRKTRLRAS